VEPFSMGAGLQNGKICSCVLQTIGEEVGNVLEIDLKNANQTVSTHTYMYRNTRFYMNVISTI
jgi:hypothetical protein